MELQGSDDLICPLCGHVYDTTVEEARVHDGKGIDCADIEQCEECNQEFLIIEYDDFYSIEERLEEDDDLDDIEED